MTAQQPPRAVVNRNLDLSQIPPSAGPEVTEFHQQLPGYHMTPLRRLDGLASTLGLGGVYVKDESDRFGLPAFKILGASWSVEQTLRVHPETRVVVAASTGNHGRAVARAAAQRSLACRIYLPAATSQIRAALISAEGAQVTRVDGDYDAAVAEAQLSAERAATALIADTATEEVSQSATWVVDGYSTLFREIAAQTPVAFDLVIIPAGVGSFAAAAIRWVTHQHSTAAVVAVEPVTAACLTASLQAGEMVTVPTPGTTMAGLDCGTPSANAWSTLRSGLTGTITIADSETHQSMRALAREGLTIGDCGAATLAALGELALGDACNDLRAVIHLSESANILCVATEGASDPTAYKCTVSGQGP
jgi:diaminopropionate ammonia-lyase